MISLYKGQQSNGVLPDHARPAEVAFPEQGFTIDILLTDSNVEVLLRCQSKRDFAVIQSWPCKQRREDAVDPAARPTTSLERIYLRQMPSYACDVEEHLRLSTTLLGPAAQASVGRCPWQIVWSPANNPRLARGFAHCARPAVGFFREGPQVRSRSVGAKVQCTSPSCGRNFRLKSSILDNAPSIRQEQIVWVEKQLKASQATWQVIAAWRPMSAVVVSKVSAGHVSCFAP